MTARSTFCSATPTSGIARDCRARPTELSLPGEYVAVKFYTGPALPDTEMNRALVRDLVSVSRCACRS